MKFLICKSDSLVPVGVYEADAINPDAVSMPGVTLIHAEVQPGTNVSYCSVVYEDNKWKAKPKVDAAYISQILQKNEQFAAGVLAEFAAENKLMGITDAQTATFLTDNFPLVMAVKFGYFPTAIHMMKNMDPAKKDGVFITDERLLKIVNKLESFSGLPQSSSL